MPQVICGCCSKKLRAAHAFVQQAQEVNAKLCSMLQQSDDVNKPLDCLQKVQIDIGSCAEIKMEQDSVYEDGRDVDVMTEAQFLKRVLNLSKNTEEDTLAATF
ncbi:hypothetical protein EVAR_71866_1 [Eumeta japonica]|uniref:ZAD domain-containing protein n=1 Tax=Eumeta variegata TaxID=151549 RepID=A0A4C1SSF1_EUMVA|nr:hypothetical protein EVAR_71866_1 [Eumeta japonica]